MGRLYNIWHVRVTCQFRKRQSAHATMRRHLPSPDSAAFTGMGPGRQCAERLNVRTSPPWIVTFFSTSATKFRFPFLAVTCGRSAIDFTTRICPFAQLGCCANMQDFSIQKPETIETREGPESTFASVSALCFQLSTCLHRAKWSYADTGWMVVACDFA